MKNLSFARIAKISIGPLAMFAVLALVNYLFGHKAGNDPAPWFAIGVVLGPLVLMAILTSINEVQTVLNKRLA